MHFKRTIWLAMLAVAALSFPNLAKAGSCGLAGPSAPNCFTSTDVVYLYYGNLTVLAPNGTLDSTTNIVTAETGLGQFGTTPPGVPAAVVDLFPGLVGQLESDPQSTFADFPSYLYPGLTNLADTNGFGFVQDPSALLFSPQDPAAASFDQQLANVSGPYTTISDTGYQTQPFSAADCAYVNSFIPGACTGPTPGGGSQYVFTYLLGPDTIDGDTYTSFVNFQIYSRDVTEQLVATPEPAMWLPLGICSVLAWVLHGFRPADRGRRTGWLRGCDSRGPWRTACRADRKVSFPS
jgi:hypothetical protein